MDENQNFMRDKDIGLSKNSGEIRTTALEGYNYAAEREFKLAVLNWLNNGKPKYFRSPAEGNYVVRLMNVSLSPDDALGRLIHTFSCTAYECDSVDYDNLINKKLIPSASIEAP